MSLFRRFPKHLDGGDKAARAAALTPIDRVWNLMIRGLRPDGSAGVPKRVRKRHYVFTHHQNKRECERRVRQAFCYQLASDQFPPGHRKMAINLFLKLVAQRSA